ncbi:MAG: (Fe-S)-binding protein [Sporolactobacillus sp.]
MSTSQKRAIQKDFQKKMDGDELLNCMRCGFCLPSCPTYAETDHQEMYSPRGRIALMKGIAEGIIEIDEDVVHSLDLCLGCRACEPVCPSGVKYGHLLADARTIIQSHKHESLAEKAVRKGVFNTLFLHQNQLEAATGLLGFYQRSGLSKVVRKVGIMHLFPESMATMERVLPPVPKVKAIRSRAHFFPHEGEKKATAALFTGCLMDTVFFETNNATIRLLQKAGCDVIIPDGQGCCGALHGHNGELGDAKELARRNIAAFEDSEADYIVSNAGGCGAFQIEYGQLLAGEPEWVERANQFTAKLKDISAILVELAFHRLHKLQLPDQTVTYQDSCHLRNVMHTYEAPRLLIQSIKGVHYVEMEGAGTCCASGGDYNIVQPQMAMQILDHKMKDVERTRADTIVTANPGCLLEMKVGVERRHRSANIRVVHLADLLLEALKPETARV